MTVIFSSRTASPSRMLWKSATAALASSASQDTAVAPTSSTATNVAAIGLRRGQRESITLGVAMSLLMITAATLIGLLLLRPIGQLHRQAAEDPLTGLSNRRSFNEEACKIFQQAMDNDRDLTALMIDIDNFKQINDLNGHQMGDRVLTTIAQRLEEALPDLESSSSRC